MSVAKMSVPSYMISTRRSDFHQSCVPKDSRNPAAAPAQTTQDAGGKPISETAAARLDAVKQDEIWKQAVAVETKGVKSWQENWGFMTEFDAHGRPKSAKSEPDEKATIYSESVPNTQAGVYGSRLNTEQGQLMQNLEFQFNHGTRKKKMGSEMICY